MAQQGQIMGNFPSMKMSKYDYEKFCEALRTQNERKSGVVMCQKIEKLRNKTANQLLQESGQGNSIPVDITAVLKYYGISALPMDFSTLNNRRDGNNILGALVCMGENVAIFYGQDETMSAHRIRFTVAHELAHVCLTGEENHVEFRCEGTDMNQLEIAANIFAGELLIPQKQLEDVIQKLLVPTVEVLADIFSVSSHVMKERLDHLNIKIDNVIVNS